MFLTKACLSNPIAVLSAILVLILLGVISVFHLPVQLIPDVHKPTIVITTTWRAAAPSEVESNLIEPQENVLRGLPGIDLMESSATQGKAVITLRYNSGTDIHSALLEVINRLNQVSFLPPDADEPIITRGAGESFTAVAYFSLRTLVGNANTIESYQAMVEDVIQPELERVAGVSSITVFGSLLRPEVHVVFDAEKVAALALELPDIIEKLSTKDDVSAGFKDVNQRQYTLRLAASYRLNDLENMILDWRDGAPVFLRDIAEVKMSTEDKVGVFTLDTEPAVVLSVAAEQGQNTIRVNSLLQQAVKTLNEGLLSDASLELVQVYDQTIYIDYAITQIRNNLAIGIILAIAILWCFLRRTWATALVAISIPLALLASFVALYVTGRSLNIISMAGLAFAIGIVLDPAIVVLEGIIRKIEDGSAPETAARQATAQVWGALLASTTTTVIIFLPIIFLDAVAGQLFRDLAIAISVAVVASLLIAMTVLPSAAIQWAKTLTHVDVYAHWWKNIPDQIMAVTNTRTKQLAWVLGLFGMSVLGSIIMFPKMDYLPKGNQNSFFTFILPPPGLSIAAAETEIMDVINTRLKPYTHGERTPAIEHVWVGVFDSYGFMGGNAKDRNQIEEVVNVINTEILTDFPDTIAFSQQAHLFQHLDGGRTIDFNIQAFDEQILLAAARRSFAEIQAAIPGAYVQPLPSLIYSEPQLKMLPNERRMVEYGWTREDLSSITQALGTGLFVGEYFDGKKRIDTFFRVSEWQTPEDLQQIPLYSASAGVVPFGEVVSIKRTAGPNEIRRVDGLRTITLRVRPAAGMSLETAVDLLKHKVSPQILPLLSDKGYITYRGTAENFVIAVKDMLQSFLLALVILFLMMAALFRSFTDSLLVFCTIPLALVGSFGVLQLSNLFIFQPLDLLTMIGFVVMLGLTVNNAILLVHQTHYLQKQGVGRVDAIGQAINYRLRPILMTTLTSIFGMLPLLLVPGAGAELYRGIAAVIVGGISVSMVFTMLFLPSLLQLSVRAK
jgi:hydrophobic/amphiphilic exporter-1 (mainly G- bacteria), HAE1 family